MIEVKNLTKVYGSHTVVNHLNFTIESGKIYGFLGPNGAGKTTTMNMITGCLASTEGQVLINGHDILEEPELAKRSIGYLPELPPVYSDMTPAEYLTFVAEAKGVKRSLVEEQVLYVMEKTQITGMKDRLIRNLSKGYRQRVGIAQAILGDPELIILDEPTVGLDPKQIIEIRDLILGLGENHTVILSSHILAEISAVCDHVMILSHGTLVASDTLENIRRDYIKENSLALTARGTSDTIEALLSSDKLPGLLRYEITQKEAGGDLYDITLEAEQGVDLREAVFLAFAKAGIPLLRLTDNALSLEEVFIRLTSDPVPTESDENDAPDDENGEDDADHNEEDAIGDEWQSEEPENPDDAANDETSDDEDDDDEEDDEDDDDDYKPLFGGRNNKEGR